MESRKNNKAPSDSRLLREMKAKPSKVIYFGVLDPMAFLSPSYMDTIHNTFLYRENENQLLLPPLLEG